MTNLRLTTRKLTDGGVVHQVRFNATHADNTHIVVTLEANDREAAGRLFDVLRADVAYAETDPS